MSTRSRRIMLGVNVDHVATLRQARGGKFPDPVRAAKVCEQAGSDSIVCHLREDRRHINDHDLKALRNSVTTKLNLEMSCAREIVEIALRLKPDQATLVPERRREITTEGGLNVAASYVLVAKVIKRLSRRGIEVSLFIDPEQRQIQAAGDIGADCVELHTGRYANARNHREQTAQWRLLAQSAEFAKRIGLRVFAGHGLNYDNLTKITKIKELEELNIGHAIIARSVFDGLETAVKQMLALIGKAGRR